MIDRLSLPALATRSQLGDRAALEALLRALEPRLLAHIRTITRDRDVSADALQETLVLICRRLATLREPEWIRAWAYRIASREAFRAARAARGHRDESIYESIDVPAPVPQHLDPESDLLAELPARLSEVPHAAQIVLRMRYLQELSQQEIAEALDIPLGTVKSRIAYGLSVLRRTMARHA